MDRHSEKGFLMNDEPVVTRVHFRFLRCQLPIILVVVAMTSFAAGYLIGVARQEKRLLNEFVINAARLGIIDYERLKELTEDADTNDADVVSRGDEPWAD